MEILYCLGHMHDIGFRFPSPIGAGGVVHPVDWVLEFGFSHL